MTFNYILPVYIYLLKHACNMSLFKAGYFLVPKQLEFASVVGLKKTVNRLRNSLVGEL